MKKSTWIIAAIIVVALIISAICLLPWPTYTNTHFTGTLLINGEAVDQPISITVQGKTRNYLFQTDTVLMNFTASGLDGWTFCKELTPAPPYARPVEPYIIRSCALYSASENEIFGGHYALSLEKGMLLIKWADDENTYILACSADTKRSPEEILEYFSVFNDCFDCSIPESSEQPLNWSMSGTMITGSGKVLRSYNLSISGTITYGENGEDQLALDIRFPTTFEYWYNGLTTYTSESRKYFNTSYPVSSYFSYNRDTDYATFSVFAVCPEKEYAIFNWEDGKDQYFVASTDPNVPPQEILSYFKTYIEKFVVDD